MKRRLLEAVADIAYIAGQRGFYSGDSRADMASFISWAEEFEKARQETNGDETYFGTDYMSAVEEFANRKMAA